MTQIADSERVTGVAVFGVAARNPSSSGRSPPLLLEDCTAEPIGQANHDASLHLLGRVFGWTCRSEDLLAALKQPATAPSS
jgi:hypothetical protein